jgi:hypothetical protein
MTLAGFLSDTTGTRAFTAITTGLFLMAAFGVAMTAWGRKTATVLGSAFLAIAQFGVAYAALSKSPSLPADRLRAPELLRACTLRWAELGPAWPEIRRKKRRLSVLYGALRHAFSGI